MRIKSFEVHGLLGSDRIIKFDLKDDLNIVTGLNGSGKTTLIKLMWYMVSGNIQHALEEITFRKATVETDIYRATVYKIADNTCKAEIEINNEIEYISDESEHDDEGDHLIINDARDTFNERISKFGNSLFFPTFRRIEGGFTIQGKSRPGGLLFNASRSQKNDLQDAVLTISRRLSGGKHTFVTSISTIDVVELMLRKYTELSEESNNLQRTTSQEVIDRIKKFKMEEVSRQDHTEETAEQALDGIRAMIENMDSARNSIMAPMQAVQKLGSKLFQHAGIRIGSRFNFGDAANAVNSDSLSAGEKQMLSFICYNALTENSVIFIDEPELSLHVDWQRQLFPTLLGQGTSNQFIIATHSPFIYSKYPDKELLLVPDRGDGEQESSK